MISLINGECLEKMRDIPSESVDLVLTDPPYGTTACKWDTIIPFEPMWAQLKRVIKKNGAIVLFGSQPFTSALIMSNPKMYRYDWYWQKDKACNFLFGNKQPLKVIEIASVFYTNQPTYHSQKTINPKGVSKRHLAVSTNTNTAKEIMPNMPDKTVYSKTYEPDKLLAKQLIYFARDQRSKLHPTQKPVALMEYLIRTYTNENDTVLDFTMGSGSCGVAAKLTKRSFIGIELDPTYFNIAKSRIESTEVPLL
jgi:site-specific DNA-methyltransferase (adenine-specific)